MNISKISKIGSQTKNEGTGVKEKIARSHVHARITRDRYARARFFCTPNRVLFASILSFFFFLFPNLTHAQTLRISPAILKIELSPGSITEHIFTVENLLSSPLPLKTNSESFDANDEESGFNTTETSTSPLASWISIDTPDTIIPASSSAKIKAKITVPKEVPLGGYYAVIFFTPLNTPSQKNQTGNQITSKVGAITLANIGITSDQNKAEISEFGFDKTFYNNQSPQVTLRTKNTGLNFFTAKPQITIDPLIGQSKTIDWEEKTLLPGKTRRWEKNWICQITTAYSTKSALLSH